MSEQANADALPAELATTVPADFPIRLIGYETQEEGERIGYAAASVISALSRRIDMRDLDGITVAKDFRRAAEGLDIGVPGHHNLRQTKGPRLGVSMTVPVMRENKIKSHMLFNDADLQGLLVPEDISATAWPVQVLALECAHVLVRSAFNARFPDVILRQQLPVLDLMRWTAITTSWDAFASASLSAPFGENQIEKLEKAFLEALEQAPNDSNNQVIEYRKHANVDAVLGGVFEVWGTLTKIAGYLLGTLDGRGKKLEDCPAVITALEGHPFKPVIEKLNEIFISLAKDFGRWENSTVFEPIGDLVQGLVENAGLHITRLPEGKLYVHIPHTPATV